MVIVGLVLAGVAALIHVYIFYLESFAWTRDRTRAVFGIARREDAETMRLLAFNQGFYNLFLAVDILLGIVFVAAGNQTVGATLVFVGAGSMVAAGIVLLASAPSNASGALKQAVPPLLAIVALAVGLAV